MSEDNGEAKPENDNSHPDEKKDEASSSSPCTKKAKTTPTFLDVLNPSILTPSQEQALKETYLTSKPYKHARIEDLFQPDFLAACKEQIKQNSKVNFKETDLFRVYQSIDLANLGASNEDGDEKKKSEDANTDTTDNNMDVSSLPPSKIPAVMQLRDVLYSQEWRSYIERVTDLPPGTLNSQVDCACNCHAPGCHLLCHDDVIGTRKVSYIIYLTEPDWKAEEGGALELYDSHPAGGASTANGNKDAAPRLEPDTCPAKTVLPLFNSMAFFVVEPGVSFHAVQEVLGERPRLSVQGWYHAASVPEHVENSTLNCLKEPKAKTFGNKDASGTKDDTNKNDNMDVDDDPFIPLKDERVQPLEQRRKQRAANADKLLDSDRDYLALYVNETYLTKVAMEEIRQRFEEDSSVQLRHFFRTSWMTQVKKAIEGQDAEPRPGVEEGDKYYQWGVSDEWNLAGPSHKQRYLRYQEPKEAETKKKMTTDVNNTIDPIAMTLPPQTKSAGHLMSLLKQKVMQSPAFGRYVNYVTSLGVPLGYRGQIRRFRPGLDYTVAHYGILTQKAVLDATICFAAGTGGIGVPHDEEDNDDAQQQPETSEEKSDAKKKFNEDDNLSLPEEEELDESDMMWQSDDVGGFECYIEADDYESNFTRDGDGNAEDYKEEGGEEKVAVAKAEAGPADEYNADDDTNLLSVSASNNTLSLVYRDPGTMRFIKYVGSRAPSSRWDISMEYQVPDDENKILPIVP